MNPNVEYLRQLEARVRTLENENKILRAALENSNALSENPLGEAPMNKHLCGGNSPNRIVEHNAQIESKSHTLSPAAKIQLFRTRFAGRTDLYARRWESRDGKKKGYAPSISVDTGNENTELYPTDYFFRYPGFNNSDLSFKEVVDKMIKLSGTGLATII